jgi:hypothetical protein
MKPELNREQAEARGYTVDTTVYPWFAYKGPRFNPTGQTFHVKTDRESELEFVLRKTRFIIGNAVARCRDNNLRRARMKIYQEVEMTLAK